MALLEIQMRRKQTWRKIGQQMDVLNRGKKIDFMLSAKFKLLSQIKSNLVDNCDIFSSS